MKASAAASSPPTSQRYLVSSLVFFFYSKSLLSFSPRMFPFLFTSAPADRSIFVATPLVVSYNCFFIRIYASQISWDSPSYVLKIPRLLQCLYLYHSL